MGRILDTAGGLGPERSPGAPLQTTFLGNDATLTKETGPVQLPLGARRVGCSFPVRELETAYYPFERMKLPGFVLLFPLPRSPSTNGGGERVQSACFCCLQPRQREQPCSYFLLDDCVRQRFGFIGQIFADSIVFNTLLYS